MVWASEFAKVFPEVDTGTMIGWFANAIETAIDEGQTRERRTQRQMQSESSRRHGHKVSVHFSYPLSTVLATGGSGGDRGPASMIEAARSAKGILLRQWNPRHWHLDDLAQSEKYISATYTMILDGGEFTSD